MTYTKSAPRVITAALILVIVAQYFFGFGAIGETVVDTLSNVNVLLIMMAIGLALISLVSVNTKKIINRTPGQWPYSIVLLGSMIFFFIIGFGYNPSSVAYNCARQGVAKFLELTFSCIYTRILPVN